MPDTAAWIALQQETTAALIDAAQQLRALAGARAALVPLPDSAPEQLVCIGTREELLRLLGAG